MVFFLVQIYPPHTLKKWGHHLLLANTNLLPFLPPSPLTLHPPKKTQITPFSLSEGCLPQPFLPQFTHLFLLSLPNFAQFSCALKIQERAIYAILLPILLPQDPIHSILDSFLPNFETLSPLRP